MTVIQREGERHCQSIIFSIISIIMIICHIVKELASFRNIKWAQKWMDAPTHTDTQTNHHSNLIDALSSYFVNPVWVFGLIRKSLN